MRLFFQLRSATLVAAFFLTFHVALFAAEKEKLLRDTPFEEILAKAKAGNPDAQLHLAMAYSGIATGVPYDRKESHKWYVAAATNDVPEAQLYLGRYYYREAVAIRGYSNREKAQRQQSATASLTWLAKAAKQGSFAAWVELGSGFDEGKVFAKDLVEAYKWYHLAVEKGGHQIGAPTTQRNSLSLRLTSEQIEMAKRRALEFFETQIQEKKPTAKP